MAPHMVSLSILSILLTAVSPPTRAYAYEEMKVLQYPKRPRIEALISHSQKDETIISAAIPINIAGNGVDLGFEVELETKTKFGVKIAKKQLEPTDRLFLEDGLLDVDSLNQVVGVCTYSTTVSIVNEQNLKLKIFGIGLTRKRAVAEEMELKRQGATFTFEEGEDGSEVLEQCVENWHDFQKDIMWGEVGSAMTRRLEATFHEDVDDIIHHLSSGDGTKVFRFFGKNLHADSKVEKIGMDSYIITLKFSQKRRLRQPKEYTIRVTFIHGRLDLWEGHKPTTQWQKRVLELSLQTIKGLHTDFGHPLEELDLPWGLSKS